MKRHRINKIVKNNILKFSGIKFNAPCMCYCLSEIERERKIERETERETEREALTRKLKKRTPETVDFIEKKCVKKNVKHMS